MPKGGLAGAGLPAFIGVLQVLLSCICCPSWCVIVCCYPPVLLSALLSFHFLLFKKLDLREQALS